MDYKKYHRDKTYEENESHFKNIFLTRFAIAKRFMSEQPHFTKVSRGRVLDIGASTGVMLDIFKDDGWETWGVEPSESANIAIKKGDKQSLWLRHKIYKSFFEKTELPNNYFDIVIMNHTLEHLDDPVFVLKKIHKILKTGGIVLIDVPNAGGIGAKILGNRWPYRLPNEHKHQFTRKSLSSVFEGAGFKVIYFRSRSGMFEFYNPVKEIWEALIHGKKRFFTNILNIPYDILATSVNMGDSMTMVGKKV